MIREKAKIQNQSVQTPAGGIFSNNLTPGSCKESGILSTPTIVR